MEIGQELVFIYKNPCKTIILNNFDKHHSLSFKSAAEGKSLIKNVLIMFGNRFVHEKKHKKTGINNMYDTCKKNNPYLLVWMIVLAIIEIQVGLSTLWTLLRSLSRKIAV